VFEPTWKFVMMTNSPVSGVPRASSHCTVMVPGPLSVMTMARFCASPPRPNTAPFD
jgi:hypothetical protein